MVIETAAGASAALAGKEVLDKATEGDDPQLELLREIRNQLVTQNRYAERQRYRTLEPYDLSVQAGTTDGQGTRVTLDGLRHASHLLISGATAGDEFHLYVGTSRKLRFVMGTTDPKEIDLPILINGQVYLVDSTTLDDVSWRAFLFVYSDTENLTNKYA